MKHMSDLGLEDSPRATQAVIGLPADVWESLIPKDNPMIAEKVSLGEKLYFDKRLSTDRTVSCGACHDPATALPRQKHNRHRHRAEERRPQRPDGSQFDVQRTKRILMSQREGGADGIRRTLKILSG